MANRLAQESSPYLRQHAENPVDWLPWGEEALRRARELDRPIFLSIGYAACHWCHVMAHESFEDPETAALLNRDFVAVKVDREERPDVDSIYMDAVVAMTGQGGWPLSVFLTTSGEPFFGGTYFPPKHQHGMPAFLEVLDAISSAWRGDRQRLEQTARQLTDRVSQPVALDGNPNALDPSIETQAMQTLGQQYDWDNGGWGGAPKFPQASVIGFLLRRYHRTRDRTALDMAAHCLDAMASGGIFDHLAGGFHRYAVDRNWTVPHFEKMLYDNALLARVYMEAWQVTGRKAFRQTAVATLDFMHSELMTADGGFSSSLDADSEGEEGRYYTWTTDEIEAAIGEQGFEAFGGEFDLPATGNFDGRLVLRRRVDGRGSTRPVPAEDSLTARPPEAKERLLEVRAQRPRPALDDKVVTAWNGLALSTWAAAARVLRRPADLETARRLADFLLTALHPEGRLHRTFRLGEAHHPAFLDDHAALAEGLLDLYQVDFDPRWLKASLELSEVILRDFPDPAGGFFDTARGHGDLLARPRSVADTPIPSGNAMAVGLFLRLEALTGEAHFRRAALPPLAAMQQTASRHPAAFAAWLQALALAGSPMPQLALIGPPASPGFQALAEAVHERFLPRLVIAGGEPQEAGSPTLLQGKASLGGRPTAYLCRDFTCRQPTCSPAELGGQLSEAY